MFADTTETEGVPVLRFGIVGLGRISPAHLGAVAAAGGEVVATCDCDPTRRRPEYKYYSSLEEMLRRERLDVLSVCTPNWLHTDHARRGLAHGLHCIVEKPLTTDAEDARRLGDAAAAAARMIFPVLQNRFNTLVKRVKQTVAAGAVGELRAVAMTQRWYRPDGYFADWHGSRRESGGMFLTLGIHYVDLMAYFAGGEPTNIRATVENRYGRAEVEDFVAASFKLGGADAAVTFEVQPTAPGAANELRLRLEGTKGVVVLGGGTAEKLETWDCAAPRPPDETRPRNEYGEFSGSLALHPDLYRDVVAVLERGARPTVPYAAALSSLRLTEMIYEAAGVRPGGFRLDTGKALA